MLGHRRLLSSLPQKCLRANALRSFSSTSRAALEAPVEGESGAQEQEQVEEKWSTPKDPTWSEWKKTAGKQFVKPHRPCNWLGNQPFPLNPTFKPPTPVSDALRDTLYRSFMENPTTNSVRNLAGRYHLSIKRVDAILRLKGLEESWLKDKPLQTGFQKGMEQLLGVTYDATKHKTHEDWVEGRIKTVEADALDQAEGNDKARARYQRMFWESVAEGQEPILPAALKKAQEDAANYGRSQESAKSGDAILGHHHDSKRATEIINTSGAAPGRPSIKFVDIGGQFLDPKDRMRRMKESARRSRVRSKKTPKRHLVTA
ncbi:eukaryotic mitochondrial regulator protein-domain-containing protein [Gloeopeniophorella convolvens]|nr:eukaryotic mitochondrial regulator protein-domain-containing protein [Gloeopeniophorella convolvens]